MSKHDKRAARFGRDAHYAMRQQRLLAGRLARWRRRERAYWRTYRPERDWLSTYRPRRALTPDESETA